MELRPETAGEDVKLAMCDFCRASLLMLRVIDDDQLDQLDQFGCVIQSYLHIQVIFGSSSSKAIGPGMYETNSYR